MDVYAGDFTGLVQSFKLRRINPNVLLPLPIVLSMCLSQVRLLEMVTPRYLLFQNWTNSSLGYHLKDCTKPVKSAAYTSMVRPTMEYASSVWDPTNRKKIGGLVAVRMRPEGAPESLYCVGRSCISWQLVPVPDGLGEERISEGLNQNLKKNIKIKILFTN
jgi:hypothetical protein